MGIVPYRADPHNKMGGSAVDETSDEVTSKNHPDYDRWSTLYARYVDPFLSDAWQQIYIGQFIGILVYLAGAYGLTVLAFNKRELEF